jgi:hypothetical protein
MNSPTKIWDGAKDFGTLRAHREIGAMDSAFRLLGKEGWNQDEVARSFMAEWIEEPIEVEKVLHAIQKHGKEDYYVYRLIAFAFHPRSFGFHQWHRLGFYPDSQERLTVKLHAIHTSERRMGFVEIEARLFGTNGYDSLEIKVSSKNRKYRPGQTSTSSEMKFHRQQRLYGDGWKFQFRNVSGNELERTHIHSIYRMMTGSKLEII